VDPWAYCGCWILKDTRIAPKKACPKGVQTFIRFYYHGPEDYILDHGGPFTSATLTPEELEIVLAAAKGCHIRFQLGNCYYNAQHLALYDPTGTLQYVEGVAIGLGAFPTLHGWVTIHNKVVDLTWRVFTSSRKGSFRDRVLGEIPSGWAYNGVVFQSDWIRARWAKYGSAYSFLDDIYHGFPIFQEPRLRRWEEIRVT
jgi:hypothetical protein